MDTKWKNTVIRAVRTFLQVFIGLLLAGWTNVGNLHGFLDLVSTAAVAAVPAALSLVQNALEDNTSLGDAVPKG